jgi:Helix-turn-helix domain
MTSTDRVDCWEALIDHHFNPHKVAIIEAMLWIDRPLSAAELQQIFEKKVHLSTISYHIRTLAKLGALDLVGEEKVRGWLKKSYSLAAA